ncbi:MAG: serine/threonine-protein kinase [Reyranella sp.]|nr:serine/threonine-protein kinase [Reyranella sp.]
MTEGTTEKSAIDRPEYHSALANGLVIGRYKILAVLGEGGFGITYRCHDTQLHRDVAIKEYLPSGLAIRQGDTQVLPRSTEVSKDFVWGRSRFLDEARTMAKLSNVPAVVRVHDFLEAHGTAYVVMQLLEGETLAQRLERETRLPQATIEQILPPLLDGLEQIHGVGFLHRDIKPANIMLGPDGAPTLIDFGASRADIAGRTQAMTAIFTPGFAAPEQSSAGKQGPWTDIYGLAATLYACVTGKPPPSALERLLEDDSAVSIDTAGADYALTLLAAIDVGMLLQAHARPQTIDAWRRVLTTGVWKVPDSTSRQTQRTIVMSGGTPGTSAPPPEVTPAPTPAPARHYKPMVLAAAAVALLVVGGGAGYAVFAPRAHDAVAPSSPAAATPAPAAAQASEAANRQADEARRQAEEQRLAEEAAARERERLEAEQAAAKAAEEEARARAEPGEAELKLTNRDRQKLQAALLSLGFDVGGIDGTFGPRSRQTIAAWQTMNGDVATGFFTAAQKASLMTEAAPAIAKWEDAQRRAYAEEQRRLQQQQQAPAPPPLARRGFKWPWE